MLCLPLCLPTLWASTTTGWGGLTSPSLMVAAVNAVVCTVVDQFVSRCDAGGDLEQWSGEREAKVPDSLRSRGRWGTRAWLMLLYDQECTCAPFLQPRTSQCGAGVVKKFRRKGGGPRIFTLGAKRRMTMALDKAASRGLINATISYGI